MVTELPLATGRRADVVGLSGHGDTGSSRSNPRSRISAPISNGRNTGFPADRLFFATHAAVPAAIFPGDAGLILAKFLGAELLREAPEHRLPGATRKAMLLRFAHAAALKLHGLIDPAVLAVS